MRTRRVVAATFVVWLFAAYAQQAPTPAARPAADQQANAPLPKSTVKFQAEAQLVVLNVSAKDKSGNPVEGLKASDFTVTEDGKPQQIKVFEFQKLDETVLPPPPPVAAAPVEAAPPPVQAAVAPTITPAREGEIKYKDKRLLVLYFDFQGMAPDDQLRVQSNAVKFLNSQMTGSDLVAVMTYAGELKVLKDFTDDREGVIKIIKNLIVGQASEMGNVTSDASSSDTGAAYVADDTEFDIFNTDRQLSALEDAVKMLATLPEKKALVYFGSGVSRNGIDNDAQMRATINAAIRSNVSFYPVDATGLAANSPVGNASAAAAGGNGAGVGGGSRGSGGNYSGGAASAMQGNQQGLQDTLYALANDTGGKLFVDSNELSAGIVQAQHDISSYYIVGYYTTNAALDGKFRRIKVSVNNTNISKLDYRTGYFANKEFKKFDSSDRERQLQEALMLGDPITDLSIALETDYFRMASDRYYVPVSVKMPGSDFALAKSGNSESTRLDFIGEVRDSKNQVTASVRDFITVKLKEESAQQLSKRTIAYDTGLVLSPGEYTVKFLARENETGKMGTFQTKFTVPNLSVSPNPSSLPISSVVLSNQQEKMENTIGGAGVAMRLFNFNPLVQNGQKLVPSVTRVFRKDQSLYVFVEAYEPTASKTQPVVATLAFYRGNVKAFESAPVQISDGLNPDTKAVPVRFAVPLAKIEPGKYTCQVSILEPGAQKFAFWRAQMSVLQ
ncbi:MAG TPA: VWA domain-containing protein [Bryobacteraceae bacterium]|nr:VWA domain-containing protein [Bryobacteraceae bacterium]